MSAARSVELLNRLLVIEHRSLPQYLAYAALEQTAEAPRLCETLEHIVADQRAMTQRIAQAIEDREGMIDWGGFPMDFTDCHMLAVDFLLRDLLRWQRFDVARIERLVIQLGDDRPARELAQETLGAERAHLEMLEAFLASAVVAV